MQTKVKICGLKTIEAVETAAQYGADFLGFVFFNKSPRNIAPIDAAPLAALARNLNPNIGICAVCVNPDDKLLTQIKASIAPDFVQIHGDASLNRISEIKSQGHKIILAIGVSESSDITKAKVFENLVDYILFDAKPPSGASNAGGFGISFDWSLLNPTLQSGGGGTRSVAEGANPQTLQTPWFLSGGLSHLNIKEAIAATNANLVDVSSGIESAAGVKDLSLIKSFLIAAKG